MIILTHQMIRTSLLLHDEMNHMNTLYIDEIREKIQNTIDQVIKLDDHAKQSKL